MYVDGFIIRLTPPARAITHSFLCNAMTARLIAHNDDALIIMEHQATRQTIETLRISSEYRLFD